MKLAMMIKRFRDGYLGVGKNEEGIIVNVFAYSYSDVIALFLDAKISRYN